MSNNYPGKDYRDSVGRDLETIKDEPCTVSLLIFGY